jgi:hypothetical protein
VVQGMQGSNRFGAAEVYPEEICFMSTGISCAVKNDPRAPSVHVQGPSCPKVLHCASTVDSRHRMQAGAVRECESSAASTPQNSRCIDGSALGWRSLSLLTGKVSWPRTLHCRSTSGFYPCMYVSPSFPSIIRPLPKTSQGK